MIETAVDLELGDLGALFNRVTAARWEVPANPLAQAVEFAARGICIYDAQDRLVIANAGYRSIYGMARGDIWPGLALADVVKVQAERGRIPQRDIDEYVALCVNQSERPWRMTRHLLNGRTVLVSCCDLSDGYYIATHDDISARLSHGEQVRSLSGRDGLTGLANRAALMSQIAQAAHSGTGPRGAALLFVAVNRFRAINERYGQMVGDQLLCAVADRLRTFLRAGDVCARTGSDEFAILRGPAPSAHEAEARAKQMSRALNLPYRIGPNALVVGVSMGIAVAPEDVTDAEVLWQRADCALRKAKSDGAGTYCFFAEDMEHAGAQCRALEDALRRALVRETFVLHYQPILNLARAKVVRMEALLRMPSQDGASLISPADFIPAAESSGLIVPIGHWVIQEACRQAASWRDDIGVAVNISPLQFRSGGLVDSIRLALETSGLAPWRLEIEVTETIMLEAGHDALATLREIKALGVQIAMDDFGTGYSSLNYVSNFPFDKIKIDRSFMAGLPDAGHKLLILRAIANLGASLAMATTAEGVETAAQLAIARQEACTEVQGFYFSKPGPVDGIAAVIASSEARARRLTYSDRHPQTPVEPKLLDLDTDLPAHQSAS